MDRIKNKKQDIHDAQDNLKIRPDPVYPVYPVYPVIFFVYPVLIMTSLLKTKLSGRIV